MRTYQDLSLEERIEIQQRVEKGDSLRAIARTLGRSPSTISRERGRVGGVYRAQASKRHARVRRCKPRVARKLSDPALWEVVQDILRACWSPQQIAGILSMAFPDEKDLRVSHETIYSAIYLVPRGEYVKASWPPCNTAIARGSHAHAVPTGVVRFQTCKAFTCDRRK